MFTNSAFGISFLVKEGKEKEGKGRDEKGRERKKKLNFLMFG